MMFPNFLPRKQRPAVYYFKRKNL